MTAAELRDHLLADHGLAYPNVSDEKVAAIHADIHERGRMMHPHSHLELTDA